VSAEVPTMAAFNSLRDMVLTLEAAIKALPEPVELTTEEKAAIQTVINLIQRIVNPT
jgi:hypothetical protein